MASIKAQRAAGPKFLQVDGGHFVETDKVVLGASPGVGTPIAADTIDFLIPAGAQLTDLAFQLDDCDTATTFVFGVGYRAASAADAVALPTNATYFTAAGQTTGQAGGRLTCAFKPIKFEVDVYVQLLVGTAPTGISGNPEIHILAGYNCPGTK
jgi:hypothetical protein